MACDEARQVDHLRPGLPEREVAGLIRISAGLEQVTRNETDWKLVGVMVRGIAGHLEASPPPGLGHVLVPESPWIVVTRFASDCGGLARS